MNVVAAMACMCVVGAGLSSACGRGQAAVHYDAAITDSASPPLPKAPALSLIYSSDLQGRIGAVGGPAGLGGLARRATLVDRARLSSHTVVQVDAGDFLPMGIEDSAEDAGATAEQRLRVVVASYSRMGVDVVTPGERELALGPERLRSLLGAAGIPIVLANLSDKHGKDPFPRDRLIDAGGKWIGVFGILDLPVDTDVLKRWELALSDPVEEARAAASSLRARGARLVVGLFHLAGGIERASEVLAHAPGIDIVVLGHGGDESAGARIAGSTHIVYAGALGERLGRLDVRSVADGAEPVFSDQWMPVTTAVPAQLGVGLLSQTDEVSLRIRQDKAAAAQRSKNGEKEPDWLYEHWDYASNAACAMCHPAAFEFWKKTDHAQAFATLKKSKHDEDPACLGCHTTGYLQPGGTRNLGTLVKNFTDVGCECCHGPSVAHVTSVDKKAKMGTSRTVAADVCLGCHTPDQGLDPFDYEIALKAVVGPGHGGHVDRGNAPAAR